MTHFRRLMDLFTPSGLWHLVALLACMVAMAMLETVGVASILPFMSLVSDPSIVTENRWMAAVYARLGFTNQDTFLLWTGVVVLCLITLSNAFTAFTHWLLLRFTWSTNHELSKRLLEQYLSEPYSYYLNRNTATLSKTLLAEVGIVITGVLIPAIRLLANAIVAVFLLALLFAVDPVLSSAVALVLGGAYGTIYSVIRRRQGRLGQRRLLANGLRFQITAEALGGIKEVKVLGRESEFLKRFEDPSQEFSSASASNAIVAQLPRYALEAVAFGGILLIVLYLLSVRRDMGQVLPIVSLYAFAGYRMMPALQQVFSGLTTMKFNAAALERLHQDLVRHGLADHGRARPVQVPRSSDGTAAMGFEQEIRFDDVWFNYHGAAEPTLRGIDLTIPRYAAVGLVGSTGSGKTTLVDLLLGLHLPDRGAVFVDDVRLTEQNVCAWRRRIGYVPQHIFLCDDSIARNIAFGIPEADVDMAAVEASARTAHLHAFVTALPSGYGTVVGERGVRLSGGQRQRIGIARALYHDPDVLVMDEATSALDGVTESAVMQAIQDLAGNKTIVLIAHRLTTVRDCDTIVVLENGRVTEQGSHADLAAGSPLFRAMARESSRESVGGGA